MRGWLATEYRAVLFEIDSEPVAYGLNITVQSYRDHLDFGLIACRELVPDLWDTAALFPEALEEFEKRAGA
jgi:hypothetical protein